MRMRPSQVRITQRSQVFMTGRSITTTSFISFLVLFSWLHVVQAEPQTTPLRELPRPSFRTTPPVFEEWNFEKDQESALPTGFTSHTIGEASKGQWQVTSFEQAPSGAHTVVQSATCPDLACLHVLLAEDIDLQYVDLTVKLRKESDTSGSGGVIFAAKDANNFYGVLLDPHAKLLQAIRVLDGNITVLAKQEFQPQDFDWHLLRIQRRTIVSKDFVNIHLDHHRILSVSGSEFKSGTVGIVTTGQSAYAFDNLRAMEVLTGRPLSRPPAY